jgi:hypothetical protein
VIAPWTTAAEQHRIAPRRSSRMVTGRLSSAVREQGLSPRQR